MSRTLILAGTIVTSDNNDSILIDHALEVENDRILSIKKKSDFNIKNYGGEVIDYSNLTLIPGFVQTHIHLCQTLFRGMADDLELLDWLQLKIFPLENAHNINSLSLSAQLGINELIHSGTTTILDMGTLRHQEVIYEELINSGIRAFAGKCLIDMNDLFPEFKSDSESELKDLYNLAKSYHNSANDRVKLSISPRFVLSCTEKLLMESFEMKKEFSGSVFHTHSSENKNEVAEVKRRFGKENIEYFASIGLLDDHSVFAHCIHICDSEINQLKQNSSKISHCPSSNLKLGSGIADIPKFIAKGLNISLGSDGAPCNNNLSIFNEMRLASLIQKPIYGPKAMDPKMIFRLATVEGAKALNMENEIGSIEVGKKADLVLLNLSKLDNNLLHDSYSVYSDIVFSSSSKNVVSVMVDGKWLMKNGVLDQVDEEKLVSDAESELRKLIFRLN